MYNCYELEWCRAAMNGDDNGWVVGVEDQLVSTGNGLISMP
jgi:hypothetical protein